MLVFVVFECGDVFVLSEFVDGQYYGESIKMKYVNVMIVGDKDVDLSDMKKVVLERI